MHCFCGHKAACGCVSFVITCATKRFVLIWAPTNLIAIRQLIPIDWRSLCWSLVVRGITRHRRCLNLGTDELIAGVLGVYAYAVRIIGAETREFLLTRVKEHPIWQHMEFWESALFEAINTERAKECVVAGTNGPATFFVPRGWLIGRGHSFI